MHTRRNFLKRAALFSGSAGMLGVMPPSILRALAIDPEPGTTWEDAEHVVIIMQENRSFDHCFGSLRGVRGFEDPRALQLANGNMVWLQTNHAGETYSPFRLDIKDTRSTWMGALPHSRESQVDAWNGGAYDRWLDAKRLGRKEYADIPLTLGYHTREDLPFYYSLADAFTVCDQHFCGAMTSTFPNRSLFWTGTIRAEASERSKANIRNEDIVDGSSHWKTFPERLQENGVSWRFYQNEMNIYGDMTTEQANWVGNFGCNPLEYFTQYNIKFSPAYLRRLKIHIDSLLRTIQCLKKQADDITLSAAERYSARVKAEKSQKELDGLRANQQKGSGAFEKLTPTAREIHQRAFTTNESHPDYRELTELTYQDGHSQRKVTVPKGDILHQFREDVDNGKLPAVSWLMAPQNFSDHPVSPWYGAWYLSEVMDILTRNPEIWKKTVFIVTYDENDGYFDHVPPFVAADPHKPETGQASKGIDTGLEFIHREQEIREGVSEESSREGPVGLGFRVPMIVASPWSRGGWVNSQVFDLTSTLQFLEKFASKKCGKKIEESNISTWRRSVCGDLTSIFRPSAQAGREAALPFLDRDPFIETIYSAQFKHPPAGYRRLTKVDLERMNTSHQLDPHFAEQEKGIRPSCALPYELYAESAITEDGKAVAVRMRAGNAIFGDRAAGSPFNIYAYLLSPSKAEKKSQLEGALKFSSYAVTAGDTLDASWPMDIFENQQYQLHVAGPNGFFREFRGNPEDPRIAVSLSYEPDPKHSNRLTGNIHLHAIAALAKHDVLRITDNAYGRQPIEHKVRTHTDRPIRIHLGESHGWYDFTVTVDGFRHFRRRYAGRVETGQASSSDPVIGRRQR